MMRSSVPRLGVGAWMSLLLLCGTFLLPPVTAKGQTKKNLKCLSKWDKSKNCTANREFCCFREYKKRGAKWDCLAGSSKRCKGGCVDVKPKNKKDKDPGIFCTCADRDDCNGMDENPWLEDKVYEKYRSGSSRTFFQGLLLVWSLPPLLTALFL